MCLKVYIVSKDVFKRFFKDKTIRHENENQYYTLLILFHDPSKLTLCIIDLIKIYPRIKHNIQTLSIIFFEMGRGGGKISAWLTVELLSILY